MRTTLIPEKMCLAGAFAAIAALAACDTNSYDDNRDTMSAGGDVAFPRGNNLPTTDPGIVDLVMVIDQSEVEAAELARAKASNERVKSYARDMLNVHRTDMNKLRDIAGKAGIQHSFSTARTGSDTSGTTGTTVPRTAGGRMSGTQTGHDTMTGMQHDTGSLRGTMGDTTAMSTLMSMHERTMSELQSLSGAEFDRRYIDAQVNAHTQALEMLQQLSMSAQHAEVRDHLSAAVPVVQQHLERAREIQSNLSGSGKVGDTTGIR